MSDESDGLAEAFDGQLRVLVTAAGRVGEVLARLREEMSRRAQAESEQRARELTSRLNAEREAARTEYGPVYRSDWWDNASAEQIGSTLATARAWAGEDPEAARAADRMRDELRTRYGVDVDATGADPAAVQNAVDAELSRRNADTERQNVAAEEAEAAELLRQADTADRKAEEADARADVAPDGAERDENRQEAAEQADRSDTARSEAEPRYDSAERRQKEVADLEARGVDPKAVEAKMAADAGQAKPATAAVQGAPAAAAKARPARGGVEQRTRRTELRR